MLVGLAGLTTYQSASQNGDKLDYAHYLIHPMGRIVLASLGLFVICGFALVRLGLPASLRRHELLWYAPAGACVAAIALTVLGFAYVPFHVSLGVVLGAGALSSVYALYRRPLRLPWRRDAQPPGVTPRVRVPRGAVAWAVYAAVLIAVLPVIPMMREDFMTVLGQGSDAHLAVGTAQFLQHHYPTAVNPGEPVDEVPLVWRSKTPIYYDLGAAASLSGLEPLETISTLQALLLALSVLGFFLVARELLGTGAASAVAAMFLVGMDRMVLHTVLHPYYNQTWGFFAMPFALVLAWTATREGGRHRTPLGLVLLALFLAIEGFAYPLALPIPVLALVVFFWLDRRARRRSGEPVRSLDPRRLVRGRRSALWVVPLGLVLIVPVAGIAEKVVSASKVVLNPSYSLGTWAGDLSGYFPENQFLSLDSTTTLFVAAPFLLAGIFLALRGRPRALAWGLAAVLGFAVLAAAVFRARAFGYYFHFKVLAFVGPLAVVIATAGFSRLRRLGPVLITLFLLTASVGAQDEISATFNQLPQAVLALRGIDRSLPAHSSIRLDINPQSQLWPGYLLYHHPLCSQHPLMHTSYPHVPISRKADFILVNHDMRPPSDAAGPALASVGQYVLYRERASVPGPSLCSERMVQTVTTASS